MNSKTQTIDEMLEELRQSSARHYHEHHNLTVKFKKLHDDAVLPEYGTEFSAGMDCVAVSDPIIEKTYVSYNLGIAIEIPAGYVGYLFPRSSISKQELVLANSVGIIDSDYRGEVQARFKPTQFAPLQHKLAPMADSVYAKGDKICQLIIMPVPKVMPVWTDELSDTVRGVGGFGSTDT